MAVTHKNPIFNDENAAREHFEALRWPNGPTCPFCSTQNRVAVLGGKSMGPGWYHCKDCRKKFTALVGTIYERSHIPLTMWLYVTHLMCASKKGISSHQIMRMTGLTYKSAWFMMHRIREAMTDGDMSPMGGEGGIVEIDETFIGKKAGAEVRRGFAHKHAVMSLVERRPEGARIRSFHVAGTAAADLLPVIKVHVSAATHVMTDEAGQYTHMGKHFAAHDFTTHSKGEYVRAGASYVHTNTVEGYYSVFKRGMVGIYQHCAEHHLHRYVAEFDFRYNNRTRLGVDDKARATKGYRWRGRQAADLSTNFSQRRGLGRLRVARNGRDQWLRIGVRCFCRFLTTGLRDIRLGRGGQHSTYHLVSAPRNFTSFGVVG